MRVVASEQMRENLALRTGEKWKPPVYEPGTTKRTQFTFRLRRYFDLQFRSIWRDLSTGRRGTIADVGCGAQPYRSLLDPTTTYIGVDTDDAATDFGHDMNDVRRLDGDRWPLADGEADVVLSTETLEHVPTPASFLAEAHRSIRPGVRLVMTVPFAAGWHYLPLDYWRFTRSSLRRLLEDAGFEEVVVWGRGDALTVAAYKVMALLLPLALPARQGGPVPVSPPALFLGAPIAVLAAIGNWSLDQPSGEDCLGYTVTARRRGTDPGALVREDLHRARSPRVDGR